ncbi:initiation-specific alpha-1,6-mannosyltransferase [Cadophora sp. MPI-SDFR-AT-0126]|nr:initiation-specific alpha-1,6-mannosyltransferase [Leotiomycetes sp. MPI-SDFR-AT-0126]
MLVQSRPVFNKQVTAATLSLLSIIFLGNYYIDSVQHRPGAFASNEPQPLSAPSPVTITVVHTATASPLPTPTVISIPPKLWYKAGPKGITEVSGQWINTCLWRNPSYRREILTDFSAETYVKSFYSHRPDVLEVYLAISVPILKADFLRYLILFAEGGIWSDLDVSCSTVPISEWIPERYQNDAAVVVGLEFDDDDWGYDDYLQTQFASWMIMAKPRSPHFEMVIQDVMKGLKDVAKENNVSIERVTMEMISDVVDVTGPKRMTRSIVRSLEMQLKEPIGDKNTSGLREPRLIGDVLILPSAAFAARQADYPVDRGPVLVSHHYAGSWKNEHGGEERR